MTWTLRRRLVVTVVGLLTVVAAVIGVVSALSLNSNLQSQLDQRVRDANLRASRAFDDPTGGPAPAPTSLPGGGTAGPPALGRPGSEVGTVGVVVRNGVTLAGYVNSQGDQETLTAAQQSALLSVPADGAVHGVDVPGLGSYRVSSFVARDGATLVSGLPTATVRSTLEAFALRELLVALAGVVAAALAASWLVGRELRPLVRVAATATRVANQPLSKGEVVIADRVEDRDTDPRTEVGQVGSAVNRMLSHVEHALADRHESEQQVRQFVADASHELRTPLASIRGYAELVRRSPDELPPEARHALDRVESETVRMTTLVSDMLLLARLDAGRPLAVAPVDLVGLAVDAVADAHAAGPDHAWHLELPGEQATGAAEGPEAADDVEAVEVLGDDDRLRQVLANLLSNARLHTPARTVVTVTVRREGDEAVLLVHDDGPGIPEPLRSRLFQRFTRGDASRNRSAGSTSTGLGMAIAHAVVGAHHGTIDVTSEPGSTTVTVRLPAAG